MSNNRPDLIILIFIIGGTVWFTSMVIRLEDRVNRVVTTEIPKLHDGIDAVQSDVDALRMEVDTRFDKVDERLLRLEKILIKMDTYLATKDKDYPK